MKYNKNEVTGKMRDRIILQNVTRVRSLTGFASEIWTDTTTIWAFAESKLPGSNETIIEGKNTAKNICDFTIRYISSITEESRVVFKNKIYQVKNIKISHDRRFISFQGVYYDSYSTVFGLQFCSASLLAQSNLSAALMSVIKYQASLNAFGSVSADIALVQKVASSLNAFGTLTGDITFVKNMQAALNGTAALSGGITFVQKPEASLNAFGSLVSDLKIGKTFESSLNANGTLVSNATIAKNLASSLTSSNSLAANALVSKLASASLTGAGTTAANLTVNAPSASLLLDLYPNAAAAYSLRKLRTAYTGGAVRVRRSIVPIGELAEQDIGFVAGELDTVSLLAFCGAGNGFVTTWYDQSGNGINASQGTALNQPQIVSSGVVILLNAKPSLQFDNTSDVLITSNSNNFIFNNYFYISHVNSFINYSGYPVVVSTSSDGNGSNGFWVEYGNARGFTMYSNRTERLNDNIVSLTSLSTNVQRLFTILQNNVGMSGFFNTTQFGSSVYTGSIGQTNRPLYISGNISGSFANMRMQEIIIYGSDKSADRTNISTNINTHYAIY